VAVLRTIRACDPVALEEVSGWAHDGDLLIDDRTFERAAGTLILPFEQEPLGGVSGLPQPELVSESRWAREYRMPYLRCVLRIHRAEGCDADWDGVGPSLLGLFWDAQKSELVVHTGAEPIRARVTALEVELDITDEIVSVRRRRNGRLLPFDSTSGPIG
jgi:hypothetical protein